jgi:hypothetical protein
MFKEREKAKAVASQVESELSKLTNYLDNCLREN